MFELKNNKEKLNPNIKKFNKLDTVVQDNVLIEAFHKMNRNELLVFKQIISMIDTENISKTVEITKKEIVNFMFPNIKKTEVQGNYYKEALKCCRKLRKTGVEINTKEKILMYSIVSLLEWEKDTEIVTIKFSDEIMPLLLKLKSNFTQYQIGYLTKLKSKYSIRLYEYFKMHIHKNTKKYTWEESLTQLRTMLGITNKYKDIDNFNRDILRKAQQEINKYTDVHIEYKTLKNATDGKTVTDIEFTVTLIKKEANKRKSPSQKTVHAKKQIKQPIKPAKEISVPTVGPDIDFLEKEATKREVTVEEITKQKTPIKEEPIKDKPEVKEESIWKKIKIKFKH